MRSAVTAEEVVAKAGGDLGVLGYGVGSGEAQGLGDAFGVGIAAGAFEHILKTRDANIENNGEYGHGDDHFDQGKAFGSMQAHRRTSLWLIRWIKRRVLAWFGLLF